MHLSHRHDAITDCSQAKGYLRLRNATSGGWHAQMLESTARSGVINSSQHMLQQRNSYGTAPAAPALRGSAPAVTRRPSIAIAAP